MKPSNDRGDEGRSKVKLNENPNQCGQHTHITYTHRLDSLMLCYPCSVLAPRLSDCVREVDAENGKMWGSLRFGGE